MKGILVSPVIHGLRDVGEGDNKGAGSGRGSGSGAGNSDETGDGSGAVSASGDEVKDVQILVIRVAPSFHRPHAVVQNEGFRFHLRTSGGTNPMDINEVRSAFSNTDHGSQRVQKFIEERCNYHRRDVEDGTCMLYLVPLQHDPSTDLVAMLDQKTREAISPMGGGPWNHYNLEGFTSYSTYGTPTVVERGIQIFRSGIVESLIRRFVSERQLRGEYLIRLILNTVDYYGALLQRYTQTYPLMISVALTLPEDTVLEIPFEFRADSRKIGRTEVLLPPIVVNEQPADWAKELRPVFDVLWNAFGLEQCFYYNREGAWSRHSWQRQ